MLNLVFNLDLNLDLNYMGDSFGMSPLMDPMILKADVAKPVISVSEKLGKVNWINLIVNVILPFLVILIVAFYMKSCYDAKQERLRELLLD